MLHAWWENCTRWAPQCTPQSFSQERLESFPQLFFPPPYIRREIGWKNCICIREALSTATAVDGERFVTDSLDFTLQFSNCAVKTLNQSTRASEQFSMSIDFSVENAESWCLKCWNRRSAAISALRNKTSLSLPDHELIEFESACLSVQIDLMIVIRSDSARGSMTSRNGINSN